MTAAVPVVVIALYLAFATAVIAIALVPFVNPVGSAEVLLLVAPACQTAAPLLFSAVMNTGAASVP